MVVLFDKMQKFTKAGALETILRKQHYYLVGGHSGVKTCHWLRERLLRGRVCYKQTFYGIETHRCMQITPAINHCTQNCLFCWRYQGGTQKEMKVYDEPETVLAKCIEGHRKLITGFKGDKRCDLDLWKEAQNPMHVAISLSGEPTLYPKLNGLVEFCKKRMLTTFVVTNGTMPEVLANLSPMPTQLYVTVAAPTEEIYKKLCNPLLADGWKRLQTTLDLMHTFPTRTVIRLTLVAGYNLGYEKEYADLILRAEPSFVEPKGYMFIGYSRQRLSLSNMPSHDEIKRFSNKLASLTGYKIAAERPDSRVTLLVRDEKVKRMI